MKKLLMLLTALIILSLILGTVSCGPSEPTPPVIDIDFYQIDFDLDGDIITDSSWGAATIAYESDEEIEFINLAINEQWVVQNLPFVPNGTELVLDFDLGVGNGTDVTQLLYACEITTSVLETMPSDFQTATVADKSVVMYSGEIGEPIVFTLLKELIGWLPVDFAWHSKGDIFNQPCGINECVPAAISNSLILLNIKHNLRMNANDISIGKMKDATGWDPGGAPFGWWDKKKTYMEDNDYPIETTIYDENVDLDKIIEEIRRGQDVELRVPGHAAMVVGIIKCANGKYVFFIAHDTEQKGQNKPGGEELQPSVYDPETGKFTGGYGINGRALSRIIVECPEPEPEPLDHFKCYWAYGMDEEPINEVVYLEDQFGAVEAVVERAWWFCNPVEKLHDEVLTPISNPDHHLTVYNLDYLDYEEKPQTWRVEVDNQFGTQNLTVWGPVMLAVPTQKVEPGGHEPPVGLDHYLLYEVISGPSAEPITINVTAQVETVDDPDNILGGAINVGDTITGTYTYNPATTDSNALPTVGDYRHTSSPYGITVNAGGFVFQTDPSNVDFLVEIVNDHGTPARDNYLLRSYNNLPLSNGALVEHIAWQLDDPTATALSSEALPTTPPVLTHWESIFGLTLVGHDPADLTGSDYFVRAHVTVAEAPTDVVVDLNDQFHYESEVLVTEPFYFANPVRKTHGGIVTEIENPEAHLVFYRIEGGVFETEVQVVNQFGEQTLVVWDPALLAVPSEKVSYAPYYPS